MRTPMEQIPLAENANDEAKKWIWVPCPRELYKPAYIIEESATHVKAQSNILESFNLSDIFKMNPSKFDNAQDLASLSHLNEPSVLHNLRKRYDNSLIYTYSGLFLISLNPYKSLSIYTEETKREITMKKYKESEPHIFAVANEAYRCLLSNRENQSILITGESGAGKTENTKKVIEFLTFVANPGMKGFYTNPETNSIDSLLLSSNPILEAFGNAKTVKNDNSSRFGKFIQLKFKGGNISGARIEKYLLEKSRIIHQNSNERSYHIFYYLLSGGSPHLLTSLGLTRNPADYNCLKNSAFTIKNVDDAEEFKRLQACFECLGITEPGKYYKLIAAVLHLSNIVFVDSDDRASLTDTKHVEQACQLLNISMTEFLKEILHPTIKAGAETVTYYRNSEECTKVVEGFMKMVYDSLFENLIFDINTILDASESDSFIGVLDIAGFEIFEKNSFEQLCINYTNEKLQQFFNHHMFILEQEIYKSECIDWSFIDFGLDLEPTIKTIESNNPIGILSYLDEECVMPRASDETLLNKIKSVANIEKCPFRNSFKLKHYAGYVEYEVKDWLHKNKDVHHEKLHNLVASRFLRSTNETHMKKGIFRTVSQSHRENLKRLMELLKKTNPHFVRCILPNLNKSSNEFDKKLVLEQLKCNGVLEGIRISRLGYPTRILFEDFNQRYLILANNDNNETPIQKEITIKIIEELGIGNGDYRIGNTMIFLRQGVLAEIEDHREKRVTAISRTVRGILGHLIEIRRNNIQGERLKAIHFLQKNAILSISFLKWKWWALFIRIKPLLEVQKNEEDVRQKEEQIRAYSDLVEREREEKKQLEARISGLSNAIEERKKAEELLRVALEEKESLMEGLRGENNELINRVEGYTKTSAWQKERISQCEEREASHGAVMKSLQDKIEATVKELKEKEGLIENLLQKDGDLKDVLKAKEEELKEKQAIEQKRQRDMEAVEEEHFRKQTELLLENQKLREMYEEKQKQQEEVLKRLRHEVDDVHFQNEALIAEARRKDHSIQEAARHALALKQEIEYTKARHQTTEHSLSKSESQIKELEEKVAEFSSMSGYTQETVLSLQKQLKTLQIKLGSAEGLNQELQREKEELCEENQRLAKEKIEALCAVDTKENQEKKALHLEIHRLRGENERLKAEATSGASSHEEATESLVEKLGSQLENEKIHKKQLEKKLNELETAQAISENRLREMSQQLKETEEYAQKTIEKYNVGYVPKGDVLKAKESIEKIRKDVNAMAELFQESYFKVIKQKNEQIEVIQEELNLVSSKLVESDSTIESLKLYAENNIILKKELEDLLKKNSLLKTELDALTATNTANLFQIEEQKENIEKIEQCFIAREKELEVHKTEWNRKINELKSKDALVEANLNKLQELIENCTIPAESEIAARIEKTTKPLLARIESMSQELLEAEKRVIEKEQEASRAMRLLETSKIVKECYSSVVVAPVEVIEKEKIVSLAVSDKEALKAFERKRLLGCNCAFMGKVKVVETLKENKEEVLKLTNENNLLNLRLRQADRMLEEQTSLIDGMRACITVLKKK